MTRLSWLEMSWAGADAANLPAAQLRLNSSETNQVGCYWAEKLSCRRITNLITKINGLKIQQDNY